MIQILTRLLDLLYLVGTNFCTLLILMEFALCWDLQRRPRFALRALVMLPVILIPVAYQACTGNVFYQLPVFFLGWFSYIFSAVVLLTALLLWFCYDASLWQLLFLAVGAHVVQNLTHQCRILVQELVFSSDEGPAMKSVSLLICIGFLIGVRKGLAPRITGRQASMDNRILLAFTTVVTLIVSIMNYWTYSFSYLSIATYIYQLVCCLLLLVVQFGIFDRSQIVQEREMMEHMLQEKEQQYRLSQENIDIINRKCHDIKHQLALLRATASQADHEKSLREMEDAVQIYDTAVRTGNEVLDTLLTEKSLQCEKHQIGISCIIDGKLLSFMDNTELYSLFGNALDNAIECCMQEQVENRIITLQVAGQAGGVLVTLDNYCSRPVHFQNGLPQTTKEDNGYHGFGTRSIQYVAQKYGGSVVMQYFEQEKRFSLIILFPEQQASPGSA